MRDQPYGVFLAILVAFCLGYGVALLNVYVGFIAPIERQPCPYVAPAPQPAPIVPFPHRRIGDIGEDK